MSIDKNAMKYHRSEREKIRMEKSEKVKRFNQALYAISSVTCMGLAVRTSSVKCFLVG